MHLESNLERPSDGHRVRADKKIDAMASSFKEIGDGYAKDSFSVFYFGKKIEGASASTFKFWMMVTQKMHSTYSIMERRLKMPRPPHSK